MISIILITSIGVLVCFLLLVIGSLCSKGMCCQGSPQQHDDVDDLPQGGVASLDSAPTSCGTNPEVNIYADVTRREQRWATPPEEPNRGYFSMEVLKTQAREDEQRLTPCRGSNIHNHLYVNDITPP